MLSNQTITTVKSTVPLLQEHGLTITQNFYQRLFENSPELKNIFNSANQKDSTQSRALADAVLAYAENIDNLENLLPAVERIANKHASLNIRPEHYPIVGENLLKAIQDVLKLPDNHPALGAWSEAYGILADVFINAEEQLYSNRETSDGGWKNFRLFTVADVIKETDDVTTFVLKPEDNKPILKFSAGQYITVKLPALVDGYDQMRQYSLSSWNDNPNYYQITVKKENLGSVSKAMHQHKVGDVIFISAPFGQFTLNKAVKNHVFISGGVGITPLYSMLEQAISENSNAEPITFIECCRDSDCEIFKDKLTALSEKNLINLKRAFEFGSDGDLCGRLNADILSEWLTDKSAHIYFCGPMPFMAALKEILNSIGFSDNQLHYEVFGPTTALPKN